MTNLLEIHAREKNGLPENWCIYAWERMPPPPMQHFYWQIKGAVAPPFKSGPRKGKKNWKRRDKATDKTVAITYEEHKAWLAAWEQRTGKCSNCEGDGKEWAGWSQAEGSRFRECSRCKGSGAAQTAEAAAS